MDSRVTKDLESSGLTAEDMGIKEAGQAELAACKAPMAASGYVIPYYNVKGERLPFYRIKMFDTDVKYKQPANSPTHIYFPRNFLKALHGKDYIIVTEGEKKAVKACKDGFPTVALGGVDNWRNRTLVVPGDSVVNQQGKGGPYVIKLPSKTPVGEDSTLAQGMRELTDLITVRKLHVYITFDSDKGGVRTEVQRAAAVFALQLVSMDIPTVAVRQIILPSSGKDKVGLDDFLIDAGAKSFQNLIDEVKKPASRFPIHPNLREFLNNKLEHKMGRTDAKQAALAIIADLDRRGNRMRSENDDAPYYFDNETHKLMTARFSSSTGEPFYESAFGGFLYRQYGIGEADSKVMDWLSTLYTGEDPVSMVSPQRVIAQVKDGVALQLGDSHFVVVTSDERQPLKFCLNGTEGILFEQGHVVDTAAEEIVKAFNELKVKKIEPWWQTVFTTSVGLAGSEHTSDLAALLYYISPWLLRWNGTQLPIELIIGEPGSGKSSLFEMRLGILTGQPKLRNIPQDMRDWFASVSQTGGLHVIDNVHFVDKIMRQRMSDEICRIITEPNPHIEMRQLYTTSKSVELPVNTVFAMTAIQQPFMNSDVIQRAVVLNMQAVKAGHDARWVDHQIDKFGGRTMWIAHQLLVLHKFFVAAKKEWNTNYKSAHRLANYEQALTLMAKVVGIDHSWIVPYLQERLQTTMTEADWTLEGIKEYVRENHSKAPNKSLIFSSAHIADWAQLTDDYKDNPIITNSRSLGRYLINHKTNLERIAGIKDGGIKANRQMYMVGPQKQVQAT